jgi:hypothetical protein
MSYYDYAVIAGMGRSGTNFLLDLLNLSPKTICRNECDAIEGSPFHDLPDRYLTMPLFSEELIDNWDEAVQNTLSHSSARDRKWIVKKHYQHTASYYMKLQWLIRGVRRRKLLGLFYKPLKKDEFPLPHWLVHHHKLKESMLVLKFNMKLGWILFLLKSKPRVKIFHIIRHPGGYYNSINNRYIKKVGVDIAKQGAQQRLKDICSFNKIWSDKLQDEQLIEEMQMIDLSLSWWWCFNEVIWQEARGNHQYTSILFEELIIDPMKHLGEIYRELGLDYGKKFLSYVSSFIKRKYSKIQNNNYSSPSKKNIDKWKTMLTNEERYVVNKMLSKSAMSNWWNKKMK